MTPESKEFIVNRDQISLGKLYARCDDEITGETTYVYCRHVLLKINQINIARDLNLLTAQDLVYDTYQNVFAFESVKYPTGFIDKRLLIRDTLQLNRILFLLGYKEHLAQRDISSIFRMLLEKKDSIKNLRGKFVGFMESEILFNNLNRFINKNTLYKPNPEYERFEGNNPRRKIR